METTIENSRVIRVQTKLRNKTTWKYVKRYNSSGLRFTDVVNEATDYTNIKLQDIVKDFNNLSKKFGFENVQLIVVKVTTDIEFIDITEADYLEERRKQALERLTLGDVKALNLEKLATYHKLKFHNSEEVSEYKALESLFFDSGEIDDCYLIDDLDTPF